MDQQNQFNQQVPPQMPTGAPTPATPQTAPSPTPTPKSMPAMNISGTGEEHRSSMGPVIGSIIIVLIIILGGVYLYGNQFSKKEAPAPPVEEQSSITPEEITAESDQATASLQKQGSTDSLDQLQSDLSASDLNNLDAELSNISSELSK